MSGGNGTGEDEEAPPPLTGNPVPTPSLGGELKHAESVVNLPTATDGSTKPASSEQGRSNVPPELCVLNGTCVENNTITIGEIEKDQLQSVGRHLLRIGRQLLQEMNFVEGLVEKFGSLRFDSVKSEHDKQNKLQAQSQIKCGGGGITNLRPDTVDNTEAVKAQLVEAIAAQASRLNWIEQVTEEFKHATNAAQFGSAFGSPAHSKTASHHGSHSATEDSANAKVQDLANQELRKRLTVVEAKMEKMTEQIEAVDKHIVDVHTNLEGIIAKLSEEVKSLGERVGNDGAKSEQAQGVVNDAIKGFEAQIIKLAQIVWELKCETRAQMHFAKE